MYRLVGSIPCGQHLELLLPFSCFFLDAHEISCDTSLSAAIGEAELEISCEITANPPVTAEHVFWTFSNRPWNLTSGQP